MEQEKIDLIDRTLNTYLETKKVFICIERLIESSLKGTRFYRNIFNALDQLVDATSGVVGDHMNWIHWFIASGFGKRPIKAKGREIRTIDDLIWLIDECGKKENSDGR